MLYLITGANGAGKTLNALKWVREKQLKEERPVYYNGRFQMVADFGWIKINAADWQTAPDGAIFFIDEAHNDFPVRPSSATVPEHVRMLAEHRARGFDFFLITQHPQNIDLFIRRLIGAPGWHRHVKRPMGGTLATILEWPSVNGNCEKTGAGKDAVITRVPFPKDVYAWYESASLHTGKRVIPKKVWVLLICAILVPLMFWLAFAKVKENVMGKAAGSGSAPGATSPSGSAASASSSSSKPQPLTRAEYLDARQPRLADFPHTAPVYDQVTQPTEAPYPAACVQSTSRCDCYTQQATLLRVSLSTCQQIVRNGYFVDWKTRERHDDRRPSEALSHQPSPAAASAPAVSMTAPPAPERGNHTSPAEVASLYRSTAR